MLRSLARSLAQGKCSNSVFIVITIIFDPEQSLQGSDSHLHWQRTSTLSGGYGEDGRCTALTEEMRERPSYMQGIEGSVSVW